eukprot:2137836-Amphidinium_carterae.1
MYVDDVVFIRKGPNFAGNLCYAYRQVLPVSTLSLESAIFVFAVETLLKTLSTLCITVLLGLLRGVRLRFRPLPFKLLLVSSCMVYFLNKRVLSQGPTTKFKNWAAELQFYMSLEDHNIAQLMDEAKQQTVLIMDEDYIEYELERQGLSLKDTDYNSMHRRMRQYHKNEEQRERREQGERQVKQDETLPPTPEVPDTYEPFTAEERERDDQSVFRTCVLEPIMAVCMSQLNAAQP